MKTISVPVQDYVKDGNTLIEWLGYFWQRIYENPEFTNSVQQGQGLLAAQLYLNYLESLNSLNRHNVPVFHRERWKPILIRKSDVGKGSGSLLRIGMEPNPVVGPQDAQEFIPGEVFALGGPVNYSGVISYPLTGLVDVMTCVVDNIVNPTVVLTRDVDFIVRDNTIFFLRSRDPFTLSFPRRTFLNENTGAEDQEILLWASDALIDAQYVYNFIGYVMNLDTASSEFYQNMLNALWDLYNNSSVLTALQTGVGAMLGEPTVISQGEIVDRVIEETDATLIVTDKHVYRVHPDATVRASVTPGAILNAGDMLTETIRIYDTLDPIKMTTLGEFRTHFKRDVYSLFFDKTMFRSRMSFGVGLDWEETDIISAGPDANGHPKLKFKLYGNAEDIDAFWEDYWAYLEERNISSQTCFSDYIGDIVLPVTEGTVYGKVQPLEYFMRYFLKTNAFIIVVERSKLSNPPGDRDPLGLLGLLRDVLPAHVLMIVIEQLSSADEYDLTTISEDVTKAQAKLIAESASYGPPSKVGLTYLDRPPVKRWIPACQPRNS